LDSSKTIDGKKYMWDGEDHPSESAAQEKMSEYNTDGFETELVEDDGKYYVYTRRVVTEIVVEGGPV
jgi:hypothetical protein